MTVCYLSFFRAMLLPTLLSVLLMIIMVHTGDISAHFSSHYNPITSMFNYSLTMIYVTAFNKVKYIVLSSITPPLLSLFATASLLYVNHYLVNAFIHALFHFET